MENAVFGRNKNLVDNEKINKELNKKETISLLFLTYHFNLYGF